MAESGSCFRRVSQLVFSLSLDTKRVAAFSFGVFEIAGKS